jgi:hypothetical protein
MDAGARDKEQHQGIKHEQKVNSFWMRFRRQGQKLAHGKQKTFFGVVVESFEGLMQRKDLDVDA